MKKLLVIIFILVAIASPDLALAQDKLEFDFWQAQYKLDDVLESRLDVRKLSGEFGLDYDLSIKLSYKFWDQFDIHNSNTQSFNLKTVKDFSAGDDEKLALGFAIDYYRQTVNDQGVNLFQLDKNGLDLVLDVEKKIMERVNLFTDLSYGLYSDYQLANLNLASNITYNSNYNYGISTGLKFKVGPDLRAKVGYKLQQEILKAKDQDEVIINDYDLTEFSQLQHGLFLGLETEF